MTGDRVQENADMVTEEWLQTKDTATDMQEHSPGRARECQSAGYHPTSLFGDWQEGGRAALSREHALYHSSTPSGMNVGGSSGFETPRCARSAPPRVIGGLLEGCHATQSTNSTRKQITKQKGDTQPVAFSGLAAKKRKEVYRVTIEEYPDVEYTIDSLERESGMPADVMCEHCAKRFSVSPHFQFGDYVLPIPGQSLTPGASGMLCPSLQGLPIRGQPKG